MTSGVCLSTSTSLTPTDSLRYSREAPLNLAPVLSRLTSNSGSESSICDADEAEYEKVFNVGPVFRAKPK